MTRMGAGFVLTELMLPRDGYEDVLVLGRRISTDTGAQRKYSTVLKATIAAGDLDTHTPSQRLGSRGAVSRWVSPGEI